MRRYSFSQIGTRTITRFNHHWLCHAFSAGVQITNALRDLLVDTTYRVFRGTEALMTSGMIGFGIAFVFQLFY